MDHNKNLCEALRSMRESELKRVRNEIHLMLIQLIDETRRLHQNRQISPQVANP